MSHFDAHQVRGSRLLVDDAGSQLLFRVVLPTADLLLRYDIVSQLLDGFE